MPVATSISVSGLQEGLCGLVKGRATSQVQEDTYLTQVRDSPGLPVVREIVTWWRLVTVTRLCPLTASLLRGRGELNLILDALIGSVALSPFHSELRAEFLRVAVERPDSLVSAVARFEQSMLDAHSGRLLAEVFIDWPTDPYPVFEALLKGETPSIVTPRRHQVIVHHDGVPRFDVRVCADPG